MRRLRLLTTSLALLLLLLLLTGCNLPGVSAGDSFQTQVAGGLSEARTATQSAIELRTEVAATVVGEATATVDEEAAPTPTVPPATSTPLPTDTAPPPPTSTPQPTATTAPTATPAPTEAPREYDRTISESQGVLETDILVGEGKIVRIEASGEIWSGVAFTGTNGPEGWDNPDCAQKFLLPCAHPYSLLAGVERYHEIGASGEFKSEANAYLYIAINDDTPGNGSGHFDVHIVVYP